MKWFSKKEWHFRENNARRKSNTKRGSHPSLIVGEDRDNYANIGITSKNKRGHHKNIKLSKNPKSNDFDDSYMRDDLQIHNKKHLVRILKDYKLADQDVDKVLKIINKYKDKNK